MNGAHDLGGMMGFGPVAPPPAEPVFHAAWEARAFALVLAMGALRQWSLDASRFARESLAPPRYLNLSYYEIWIEGLIRLMIARNLVTPEELRAGRMISPPEPAPPALAPAELTALVARGGPTNRPAPGPARFAKGAQVRARTLHTETHTRLPRYLRGHAGEIVRVHGAHVFPDSHAHGQGENPQWLY